MSAELTVSERSSPARAPGGRGSGVRPPLQRKASLSPAGLHRKLSVYAAALTANTARHRRKVSQAGYAVTTRLGWKVHPSKKEIVEQAKTLCGRYIRSRLRSCQGRSIGLQRLKSVHSEVWKGSSPDTSPNPGQQDQVSSEVVLAVGTEVRHLGLQLERSHPKLFSSVAANVGLQAINSETTVSNLFQGIGKELIRTEVNWGRVVALYAISGALALDCVRLGKPEFVVGLVDAMGAFVDRHVAAWISGQGGWVSLLSHFQPKARPRPKWNVFVYSFVLIIMAVVFMYVSS